MAHNTLNIDSNQRKAILMLGLSKLLTGTPISTVISTDWSKPKAANVSEHFDVVGFDLDPDYEQLSGLKKVLSGRDWDGVLVAWCTRGHAEFTDLFERVVEAVVEEMKLKPKMKLMFNTGPDNLVEPVVRNFPLDGGI